MRGKWVEDNGGKWNILLRDRRAEDGLSGEGNRLPRRAKCVREEHGQTRKKQKGKRVADTWLLMA